MNVTTICSFVCCVLYICDVLMYSICTYIQHTHAIFLPTLKEVEMAMKCLRNEKSTGIDEILIELFKASPEAVQELHIT